MTDWLDYYTEPSSQTIGNEALALFQANRNAPRESMAVLLDEFFMGAAYAAQLEEVRNAVQESEMVCGVECVGHMTRGIWDNLMDLSNTWALYPHRRAEFRQREIQDLEDARRLLNELMDKIAEQKQEAA